MSTLSVNVPALLLPLLLLLLSGCSLLQPVPPPAPEPQPVADPLTAEIEQNYQQGLALMQNNAWADAAAHWQVMLEQGAEFAGIYTNLALAQLQLQDYAAGLAAAEKSRQLDEHYCPAWKTLALLQRHNGNFAAAEQSYLKAAACAPADADIPFNLGILYDLYLQDLDNALQQYQRAQQLIGTEDGTLAMWITDLQRRQNNRVAKDGGQ